jgi:D-lactate dehydrogenase
VVSQGIINSNAGSRPSGPGMAARRARHSAYSALYLELRKTLPAARLLRDPVSTLAYGGDASPYRLIPELVVKVLTEREAALVLAACHRLRLPVTIRAAGTSLSGQALSDSVLMQIGRGFGSVRILDGGSRIRMQPAVVGAAANRLLAPHGRKLGPDPASIDSAMIGGIAANNASGMCCGTAQNCYRTLASMRIVFADGSILDTSDAGSRGAFAETHGKMLEGLSRLASRARDDAELKALILRKYEMKNTTGYGINALVEFRDPFDILQHLLIGSEGTLGFMSEITLDTVPNPRYKAAILALFPDADAVGRAVAALAGAEASGEGVHAVEYLDEESLRSVAGHPAIAAAGIRPPGSSALLIDIRTENPDDLPPRRERIMGLLSRLPCLGTPLVADREDAYQSLWAMRKGLFPAIGAMRPPGTAVIIEDVAFPVDRLAQALVDLRALLAAHGYERAIIYGHALSGNLHFVFWQDFGPPAEVERYGAFMEKLTDLVVEKYRGSLKAEHGTGRNMAPFVEKEWGKRAYETMIAIKSLFDPLGILNPDVILSADKRIHLKNLKPLPLADPIVDKCIECGFCESACPSRDATLTPRQRISVWREISRLRASHRNRIGTRRLKALVRGFAYQGERTCATDGLCALKCPVGIDTGKLIKSIRAAERPAWQRAAAAGMAGRFAIALDAIRLGLRLLQSARDLLGAERVSATLRGLSRFAPGMIPAGLEFLPRPARALPGPASHLGAKRVLYFPSCINRAFGAERPEDPPLPEVMAALLRRAGFETIIPANVEGLCCGLAFSSKGFTVTGDAKLREARAALEAQARQCSAIICDTSPCAQRLAESCAGPLAVQDAAAFLAAHALPDLKVHQRKAVVALHPPCSSVKMGLSGTLEAIASACAHTVAAPEGVPCCGVAGDRLFLHPELSRSACAALRTGIPKDCGEGYSSSRVCEIGLTRAGGIPYRSILYLLYEATAPAIPVIPAEHRASHPEKKETL